MPSAAQRSLIAALWLAALAGPAGAQAEFAGDVTISVPDAPRFGGLSAIEISEAGSRALVLSDRGTLFTLEIDRGDGAIGAVRACCVAIVSGPDGAYLHGGQNDSEGLALLPDGRMLLSFEGRTDARVAVHARNGRQVAAIPAVPGAQLLPRNGAFEGVAVDRHGRIYSVPESMPGRGPIPLVRFDGERWHRFAELPRQAGWSPVALDFDDRERLYLLERRGGIFGFAARLTRYDVQEAGLGEGLRLLETPLGRHGNLEGLSLWRNDAGVLIATMVTDDNFLWLLSTTLVEYRLPD